MAQRVFNAAIKSTDFAGFSPELFGTTQTSRPTKQYAVVHSKVRFLISATLRKSGNCSSGSREEEVFPSVNGASCGGLCKKQVAHRSAPPKRSPEDQGCPAKAREGPRLQSCHAEPTMTRALAPEGSHGPTATAGARTESASAGSCHFQCPPPCPDSPDNK